MLASYSRHPLTLRLPVEKKQQHSSKSDSQQYKSLPKLKTTSEPRVMQPHERLPGVSQLLTSRSPPPAYGRGSSHRHQSHHSADSVRKPSQHQTQHRSSLPLEDILCPTDHPSSSSSSRPYITPPLSNTTPSYSSAFYSPGSPYSIALSRGSPPRTQLPPTRSDSFTSYSAIHHTHSSSSSSDYYYSQAPKPSSRGSGETSLTSSSSGSGSSSIPPPTQARLIGEQLFPGEGLCWVYSDGSHVRKEIDGEAVNPQWGVTKAGKPRKRLAQACLTCREKKIKCDLADPKCIQCDKSGRECRYASARASRRLER